MTEPYNAWDEFRIDEATDCESINEKLRNVKNAQGYFV